MTNSNEWWDEYIAAKALAKVQSVETTQKRQKARRTQKKGKTGEAAARIALQSFGVEMVEQISTPVIVSGRRVVGYGKKVSGDLRGIMPGSGQSVLVEVKAYDRDRLPYSALRKHQPERLTEHQGFGGLSLLVWVNGSDVFIIEWPIVGFASGSSLSVDYARQLSW